MIRSVARLHVLAALLGLSIYVLGFGQQVRLAGLPTEPARETLAYPVEFGGYLAGDGEQLRFLAEGFTPGDQVLLVQADGSRRELVLEHRHDSGYLWITGLSAFFFWGMATLAFAPRIQRPGAPYFFWATLFYGMAVAVGGIYFRGDRNWVWGLLGYLHLTILAFLPILFVQLAGSFPRRILAASRLRRLPSYLLLIAGTILLWQCIAFESYFRMPGPESGSSLILPQRVSDLLIVGAVAIGIFLLTRQGRHAKLLRERQQVRWLVYGFVVGVTPYVFLRTLPTALGMPALLPVHADRILEFAIPIAMLMAVARHQFLDIDIVLRRGLIYGLLTAILLLGVLAIGLITRPLPTPAGAWPDRIIWVMAGLIAGFAYRPLRRSIAYWADRKYFRLLNARRQILERVDQDIGGADTHGEVLAVLESRLVNSLRPRELAIFAKPLGDASRTHSFSVEESQALLAIWNELKSPPADLVAAIDSTEWPAIERAGFPREFRKRGFVLAAPIRSGGQTVGLILMGPRETERHYVAKELEVLRYCAKRASARFERLDLIRMALEEESERRRLDEVNRMKSEFLSRVAHDLRTPLTSISWSSQNLRDGVVGDLQAGQLKYVEAIGRSCDYLNRLVQNLLDVSRLERGSLEFRCELGEIESIVKSVCQTLEPVGAEREVSIRMAFPEEGLVAWRDPYLLEEALVNLLENAVKYSPPGEAVDLGLMDEDGEIVITIRDRGPGIPEEDLDSLFGRFEQGPPSPFATQEGFGLGLHIARSYLDGMQGTLTATNHPQGGATFRCTLLDSSP